MAPIHGQNRRRFLIRLGYLSGLVLLVAGAIPLLLTPGEPDLRQLESTVSKLEAQYGLTINTSDPKLYFQGVTETERKVLELKPAETRFLPSTLKGLERALSRYPTSLVSEHLNHVHVVGRLTVRGQEAAGSFSLAGGSIFILANRATQSQGALFQAETFHHEFSSLLVFGGAFPFQQWKSLNPSGFKYRVTLYDDGELPDTSNDGSQTQWYERGFVSSHGATRIDDDVNTYAELLFEHPQRMRSLMADYPRIAQKAQLLMRFYSHLAPSMGHLFLELYPDVELAIKA